jgi:hypothetical protein
VGRSLIVAICMFSASCALRAQQNAPRTSSANGKTINYNLTVFNPPVPIRPDPARLNQESAINFTILFLSKLHQGDIQGAAAATEDPDTQVKMYKAYKVRVGDIEFSKNISELFEGDRYLYELRIGSEHVLLSEKHPEGAQTLIEKQGKFWLEDGLLHQSPELKSMMELVNARAEGKLQFK